jgi:hypothetical protein
MATELTPIEPTLPFLRINEYHVYRFSLDDPYEKKVYAMSFPQMLKADFDDGCFKEEAFIIDTNCWKFPIRDVVCLGTSRSVGNFLRNPFVKRVKVKYIYGPPVKLTFDKAREEVVELICRKTWFSKTQDRESQESFRTRMAKCENMRDLIVGRRDPNPKGTYIGGISFYGGWVG